MGNPPVNYEAWARNAITFIRERGMEGEFRDWCGGWSCPIKGGADRTGGGLRLCGYCQSWHSRPCGEGCCWSPTDPVFVPVVSDCEVG